MLAERIADSLFRETDISEDEREIVRFGLESLGGNLLSFGLALTVGICFKRAAEGALLWLFLFPLRKNAGGFHAKTKGRCLFLSVAILVISFVLYTASACGMVFYIVSVFGTGIAIWCLAPVENLSKKLDMTEYRVYQRRSRIILVAETGIFCLAAYFQWKALAEAIAMAFFIVTLSLMMGRLKLKKYNKLNDTRRNQQ